MVSYEKYSEIRDSANLTDYMVAKETGVPKQTISDWKVRGCNPRVDTMAKIAALFGVPIETFIVDDES